MATILWLVAGVAASAAIGWLVGAFIQAGSAAEKTVRYPAHAARQAIMQRMRRHAACCDICYIIPGNFRVSKQCDVGAQLLQEYRTTMDARREVRPVAARAPGSARYPRQVH